MVKFELTNQNICHTHVNTKQIYDKMSKTIACGKVIQLHIGCIMGGEFPAKVTPDTCSFGHLFSSGESPPPYMGQLYSHSYPNWLDCIDSAWWRDSWMFILINGQEVNMASAKSVWRQKVKKHLLSKLVCILGHGLAPIAPHVNTNHCWLTIFHISTFLFRNFSKNMLQANFANFSFDGSNLTCSRSLLDLGSAKPNERIIACRAWPSLLLASHRSISPQVHIFSLKD